MFHSLYHGAEDVYIYICIPTNIYKLTKKVGCFMKLQYFFGCILGAASLAVWPEIGLAHGGGGGGGGGGHGFGGGGGGHAFVSAGGHAFGGFTGRGFGARFSGTRGFATGRFSGRGGRGR